MKITIRKFEFNDIELKIKWINNAENNQYLHYDLPLEYEKTCVWYNNNKDRVDRYDAVIEVDGRPVGLIGLLSIDLKNAKAEYYVAMGESNFKGRGIANKASQLILEYAFYELGLEKVYLYTETENVKAQKLFERLGFIKEGFLERDLYSKGKYVNRFLYGLLKNDFICSRGMTPITHITNEGENEIYVKREDLIPYSFGGNKARKAVRFFDEIDDGDYDCVVTYGSSHSNHCRVISNMAASRMLECLIICPKEVSDSTYNSKMMHIFGAEFKTVPLEDVHNTIESTLAELRLNGKKPFFIPGGGHGNVGTQAYVDCYEEIKCYEKMTGKYFDYIFFASGTGTTHAGLVCGQLKYNDNRKIVGISIARKNPYGRNVVMESIKAYMMKVPDEVIEDKTIFIDEYTGDGYGKNSEEILDTIRKSMIMYGIPLDSTYTGKAFYGMEQYLRNHQIKNKTVLFIHTGGTPLFFDDFKEI